MEVETLSYKEGPRIALVGWWLRLCFQCRGPGFDRWSGNQILHAATKDPKAST